MWFHEITFFLSPHGHPAEEIEHGCRTACAMVGLPQTVMHPAHQRLIAHAAISDSAPPA